MSARTDYPHLVIDADGTARIGSTRYKVLHLAAEHYHHGWTAEELLRQHPDLRPEEVYAALTYFYDHHSAMLSQLKASKSDHEAVPRSQSISRAESLRRKAQDD